LNFLWLLISIALLAPAKGDSDVLHNALTAKEKSAVVLVASSEVLGDFSDDEELDLGTSNETLTWVAIKFRDVLAQTYLVHIENVYSAHLIRAPPSVS